jgi:membrane complex biogenesis BtpA family protein
MPPSLKNIFGKEHGIIIGAVHLPPSPEYEHAPETNVAIKNALDDACAFEAGHADAIIYENNYDIPHKEKVSEKTKEILRIVGKKLTEKISLPVGLSVLWNDYETALSLSEELALPFIRVPVFVDTVKTTYGTFVGNPEKVLRCRQTTGAASTALFVDIHVKHAEILTGEPIEKTALRAVQEGADALIITGNWTGEEPALDDLRNVRSAVGTFPIFCGSGVTTHNISKLFEYANGVIVSTSVKEDGGSVHARNLVGYESRISTEKVLKLVSSV